MKVKVLSVIIVVVSCFPVAISAQKAKPVLNHIALNVKDLTASTHFYQNVIQLDTIPEPFHDGRHSWFSIGPKIHLHLIQGASTITTHEKNNHLCFSVQSVEKFIIQLEKHGTEYENWEGEKYALTKRADGVKQIYFKDPDGYWIELNDAVE